jgi:hypothetical protein
MTNYRRNFISGGSFFFTINLADRRLGLLIEHVGALRTAFRETCARHPSRSTRSLFYPIIFMPFGHCQMATQTMRCDGASLSHRSHAPCRPTSEFQGAAPR